MVGSRPEGGLPSLFRPRGRPGWTLPADSQPATRKPPIPSRLRTSTEP